MLTYVVSLQFFFFTNCRNSFVRLNSSAPNSLSPASGGFSTQENPMRLPFDVETVV